jgi:oxygen-dependent protoporphyrinogen oxidase
MTEERRDAIVVGAGVSGLMAAWTLRRAGLDVAVLEAGERVGGSIRTLRRDGWLFELGPNTVLERPPLPEVLEELGIAEEALRVPLREKSRFVYRGGRLHPVPRGPGQLVGTRLFSWRAKLALLAEPWRRARAAGEETIAELVRRRLSPEWLETLVGPFVSGIYAGDPERLSARWTLGHLVELEARHGSLIRGLLRSRGGGTPSPRTMISFPDGLVRLVETLAAGAGDVRTGCRVEAVDQDDDGFRLETAERSLRAPRVVMAAPAGAAATLLERLTAGESAILARLSYAPLAVVGLGFPPGALASPPAGTGFLVPRGQGPRILGCLCSSNLFPGRAPGQGIALTLFLGGALDPEIVAADDATLVRQAIEDVDRVLGVRVDPVVRLVQRWPEAIPQYEVGHGFLLDAVERWTSGAPGLALCGSYLRGVALPDALASGRRAAAALLDAALVGYTPVP